MCGTISVEGQNGVRSLPELAKRGSLVAGIGKTGGYARCWSWLTVTPPAGDVQLYLALVGKFHDRRVPLQKGAEVAVLDSKIGRVMV